MLSHVNIEFCEILICQINSGVVFCDFERIAAIGKTSQDRTHIEQVFWYLVAFSTRTPVRYLVVTSSPVYTHYATVSGEQYEGTYVYTYLMTSGRVNSCRIAQHTCAHNFYAWRFAETSSRIPNHESVERERGTSILHDYVYIKHRFFVSALLLGRGQ
jgi:hypothetical protein